MHLYNILFLLLVHFNFIYAKTCPDVKGVENINLTAFGSGIWHDIARYPNEYEKADKCLSLEYKYDGGVIKIKSVNLPEDDEHYIESYGWLKPDNSFTFNYTTGNPKVTVDLPAKIVAIDYDSYVIFYDCINDTSKQDIQEFLWIVSRTNQKTDDLRTAIDKYINSNKFIDADRLLWIDYSDPSCIQN